MTEPATYVIPDLQPDMEILIQSNIDSVASYANAVRLATRGRSPSRTAWNALYEHGVVAALSRGDLEGLAAMVSLVSSIRLEVDGQVEDAVSHLDVALGLARGQPEPTVLLLSRRSL